MRPTARFRLDGLQALLPPAADLPAHQALIDGEREILRRSEVGDRVATTQGLQAVGPLAMEFGEVMKAQNARYQALGAPPSCGM